MQSGIYTGKSYPYGADQTKEQAEDSSSRT